MDDAGCPYVEDSTKEITSRSGEYVDCAEIKSAIYEHDWIHEAVVGDAPNERLGEGVAA